MIFVVSKLYAKLYSFFHFKFNINIRGFGWILRQIKYNFILNILNKKFFFNHLVADNYALLIIGEFNEPETHQFINFILDNNKTSKFRFIDIGANIGEFVFDYGDRDQISELIAFEPQEIQGDVIEKNIDLNKFSNSRLVRKAVFSKVGQVKFNIEENNKTSSGIRQEQDSGFVEIPCTTIDHEFIEAENLPTILLIDAEGAELEIMKGGLDYINQNLPIIIFEYNYVTDKYFKLADVENLLGEEYKLYRLNSDGFLDEIFDNIWNIVAISENSKINYSKQ